MIFARLFNLRPGDLRRGLPLFSYYFLIISCYVMGQVARDALFLDRFQAIQLPYADIAIAALVGFVVAFYIRLGRRASLKNLLICSLLIYSTNVFALWWAVHFYKWPWLYPVLYIWVGIFGVLAPAQVWTLANFVWTTREAKRLFGLLGSGGIAGGIFGGFFSTWMAASFGTESLLLIVGLFLVACSGVVAVIWKQNQTTEHAEQLSDESPRNLIESFRMVRRSPLLLSIAALICLSSIVTTAAGWQLKAIAKEAIGQKDALAVFFGSFIGYTQIASLTAQLLVTTKLLRRFGVGVALLVLPLFLVAGSGSVLISGSLWAASFLKGSDKVLRYSIDTSALQLLYLPVPAKMKLQVKSFIDTVIWRLGDGLAGLTLLVFAATLHFSPSEISWVSLAFLGIWIWAALAARRQYVATLNDNIEHVRMHPDEVSVPVLDRSTSELLASKLNSSDPNEILYGLSLFEMGQQQQSHSSIRNLLDHPSPHIRKKAVSILSNAADAEAREQITALLGDDDLEVRTEALLFLSRHCHVDPLHMVDQYTDFADFSIRSATVAFLARPGETQNLDVARMILDGMIRENGKNGLRTRLEAARVIGALPDSFDAPLATLLEDPDPDVVRTAMRTVGVLRKRRFVPLIIDRLANSALAADAASALALFDDSIVGTLRDHLGDRHVSIVIRREIPQALLRIGTPSAARALTESLLQADPILRFRILSALNKLYELRRNLPVDHQLIETVLVAEIMGHYRSYQILGSLSGAVDDLLGKSMNRELERIFRLMKLLFPTLNLQKAYLGIQSTNPITHANALEFLDNTLNPQLRTLLVPLIDSEVHLQERVRAAEQLLGTRVSSYEEAVSELIHSEDPWLRSCAVYAIGRLQLKRFEKELDRWAEDPDPLLRTRIEEARLQFCAMTQSATQST